MSMDGGLGAGLALETPRTPRMRRLETLQDEVDKLNEAFAGVTASHSEVLSEACGKLNKVEQWCSKSEDTDVRLRQLQSDVVDSELALRSRLEGLESWRAEMVESIQSKIDDIAQVRRIVESMQSKINDSTQVRSSIESWRVEIVESIQSKIEELDSRFVSCERHDGSIADLRERHTKIVNVADSLNDEFRSLRQRVDTFEARTAEWGASRAGEDAAVAEIRNDCARELVRIAELADSRTSEAAAFTETLHECARELELLKAAGLTQATTIDGLGEASRRQSEELAMTNGNLMQLNNRLAACEAQSEAVENDDSNHADFTREKGLIDAQLSTLGTRIECLERWQAQIADGHSHASEESPDAQRGHASETAILERLDALENLLGASSDRHTRDIVSLRAELARQYGELNGAKEAYDTRQDMGLVKAAMTRLEQVLETFRESFDLRQEAVGKRIGRAEELLSALADDAASAGTRFVQVEGRNELEKDIRELRVILTERVTRLDRMLGEVSLRVGGHAQELEELRATQARLSARQEHSRVESLLKQTEEQVALGSDHASVSDRLTSLEGLLSETANRHARALSGGPVFRAG